MKMSFLITVNWRFHSGQNEIHYGQFLTVRSTFFTPWSTFILRMTSRSMVWFFLRLSSRFIPSFITRMTSFRAVARVLKRGLNQIFSVGVLLDPSQIQLGAGRRPVARNEIKRRQNSVLSSPLCWRGTSMFGVNWGRNPSLSGGGVWGGSSVNPSPENFWKFVLETVQSGV